VRLVAEVSLGAEILVGAGATTGDGAWAHAARNAAIDIDTVFFTNLLQRHEPVGNVLHARKCRPSPNRAAILNRACSRLYHRHALGSTWRLVHDETA
jgi:hypothetical protein